MILRKPETILTLLMVGFLWGLAGCGTTRNEASLGESPEEILSETAGEDQGPYAGWTDEMPDNTAGNDSLTDDGLFDEPDDAAHAQEMKEEFGWATDEAPRAPGAPGEPGVQNEAPEASDKEPGARNDELEPEFETRTQEEDLKPKSAAQDRSDLVEEPAVEEGIALPQEPDDHGVEDDYRPEDDYGAENDHGAEEEVELELDAIPPGTPSLVGLDRSRWPMISTGPESGATRHYQTYHHDRPIWNEEYPFGGFRTGNQEQRLHWALEGQETGGWSVPNVLGLVAQPVNFGVDTAMMPVRLILRPPFRQVTSP